MVTGVETGCMFDSVQSDGLERLERGPTGGQYSLPSIMYSLTISHSCFIWNSDRYLHSLAASNHASTEALFGSRAGPGCGTLTAGAILRCWRGWRRRRRARGHGVWRAAEGGDEVNIRVKGLSPLGGSGASARVIVAAQLQRECKIANVHSAGTRTGTSSYDVRR